MCAKLLSVFACRYVVCVNTVKTEEGSSDGGVKDPVRLTFN